MPTLVEAIENLLERADTIQHRIQDHAFEPDAVKRLAKRYKISEAAELVGRTPQAIRKAETEKRVPEQGRDANNRRLGYSVDQVHQMQALFGTQPWRSNDDQPVILAMQNFKGGVGKSTLTCHVGQYLALRGYRTLIIDCDSQASTTSTFGYIPDDQIEAEETLLPFFQGEQDGIGYAVRRTHWDGLDLIPANLTLYTAEYVLAASIGARKTDRHVFEWLPRGVESIQDNYDVILLDPPPALGMISLNVLASANALIIPTPAGMYDFQSSIQFMYMLADVARIMGDKKVNFVRVIASRFDGNKSAQVALLELMYQVFDVYMMESVFPDSAEILSAGTQMSTVYELKEAATSRQVHKRCVTALDQVGAEIERLVRQSWPRIRPGKVEAQAGGGR